MVADFWQDLRYGANAGEEFRLLVDCHYLCRRRASARIPLAFSVVNAVLLKPLPVAQPDELVSLYISDFTGPRYGASSFLLKELLAA